MAHAHPPPPQIAPIVERLPGAQPLAAPHLAPPRRSSVPWWLEVMVVDDDTADLALVAEALRRNSRVHGVIAMHDPKSALYELVNRAVRADLVLLDINMPRIDGFTFIKALREAPWHARTPVALLTTWGHADQVERARGWHVAGYIKKPASFDELQARIDGLIDHLVVGRA